MGEIIQRRDLDMLARLILQQLIALTGLTKLQKKRQEILTFFLTI